MREIEVEGMRRHIGAFGHKAHVAEGAGLDDFCVILLVDAIDLAGRAAVDKVEQAGEAVAQIEAAPTAMADLEDAGELGLDLGRIIEIRILPGDRVAHRRAKAAFSHGSSSSEK